MAREVTAQAIRNSAAPVARRRVVPSARGSAPFLVSDAKRLAIGNAIRPNKCVTLGGAGSAGLRRLNKISATRSAIRPTAAKKPPITLYAVQAPQFSSIQ